MNGNVVPAAAIVAGAALLAIAVPDAALQLVALAVAVVCLWALLRRRLVARLPAAVGRAADLSLLLSVVAGPVRTVFERRLYGGQADAEDYALFGHRIAEAWRAGGDAGVVARPVPGTGVIDYASGVMAWSGQDPVLLGGLVSSVLGFVARLLFVLALHRLAGREEVSRPTTWAMCTLLLLPSLLYWPAALGKEGWMMTGVALAVLGVADLARGRPGVVALAAGSAVAGIIRPHIALMLLLAAGVAWAVITFLRSVRSEERVRPVVLIRAVVFAALLVAAVVNVRGFFLLESVDEVEAVLEEVSTSAQRGTFRDEPGVGSIADLPNELVAVLLRPHPLEAEGLAMLVVSLELAGLWAVALVWWLRRGRGGARLADLFVVFAGAYGAVFVVLFSNMGNFGHLVRQRVQLLPILVIAVSVALDPGPADSGAAAEAPGRQRAEVGG